MRLGISSAAAPRHALSALLQACEHRGLGGVELVGGDAHGIGPDAPQTRLADARRRAGDAGTSLFAYRARGAEEALSCQAAHFAAFLELPVLVRGHLPAPETLARAAVLYHQVGSRLLLAHDSDVEQVRALTAALASIGSPALGLAWEVRPGMDDPGTARRVIEVAGEHLAYVRLHGGGPESASQTGLGVGALMARLTLARYTGPLVLTPSDSRFHQAWLSWLQRPRGWGCGSKIADASLVRLGT